MARANPFNATNGRTWFHRGYFCFLKQRERRIRCMYKMALCNLWMPREFFWENTSKSDCFHYIDLLAAKKLNEAREFEDRKLATEHIYERGPDSNRPFVNVNAQRLLAMLRGEEVLEVPADARIRFVPPKGRYSANDVDAQIFGEELTEEYVRTLRRMVGEGRPIMVVQMPEEKEMLEKYGCRLTDAVLHSGFNLAVANGGETQHDDGAETPPAPVNETEIKNIDHGAYTETVTLITGNGQNPYFVRRLMRGAHLLWSGTSYEASGPWTEYHRDQSRLIALGIHIQ